MAVKKSGGSRGAAAATRREFLYAAAGIAATGAAVPGAARAERDMPAASRSDYDVLVVGGGFCGVTAARECAKSGSRTLLVEARNRLGGRTFTTEFDGRPTDMGGTWVHWSQPYVWAEIRRYGLPLAETIGATAPMLIVRTAEGEIVHLDPIAEWDEISRAVAEFMGPSREIFPRPHGSFDIDTLRKYENLNAYEPVTRITNIQPVHRDLLDGFFTTCCGNLAREAAWTELVHWYALSGHNFTDMNEAIVRYRLRDGTVSLIDAIVADGGFEIRVGSPVSKVHQDGGRVRVHFEDGSAVQAKVVISTLPLNVLDDIDWTPPLLPGKEQASKERHAGSCTKVHIVLEGERNVQCVAPGANALNFLCTEHMHDGTTHMVGFGPDPKLLDVNDTAQVEAAVRTMLPDARVKKSFGYQWGADPYSRGTWCVLRPGQLTRYLRDLQAQQGRVIFASADWADGWRGTIDGAIEQGITAAREARKLIS